MNTRKSFFTFLYGEKEKMIARCILQFRPSSLLSRNVYRFACFSSSSTKPISKLLTKSTQEVKHYPVPPRLPYIGGYLKDYRTDRLVLSTIDYKDRSGEERKLQIELLDEHDIGLVGQYFADQFMKDCGIVTCLNGTYEEMAPFFYDDIASKLPNKMSMIVKDDDKCVGYHIVDKIERDDFDKYFTNGSHMKEPCLDFKDNYAEDIKNGPFKSHKANQLAAGLNAPFSQTLRFLPEDVDCLLYFEAVGIDKNYQNAGLFPELVRLMHKIGKENGCDYGVVYSVAKESATISLKVWKHLFTFPYEKFKEDGKIVFDNLSDGATGIVVAWSKI